MADILSKLQAPPGANTPKRRVGRGVGSGLGKTGGRGQKGQKARSKGNINKLHFHGGQTTFQRRLPKRGFRNPFPTEVAIVPVGALDRFEAGTEVTETLLRIEGLVSGRLDKLKILGDGELTKALTVQAHSFSRSAREKIEKAGGKIVEVAPKKATEATESASLPLPPWSSPTSPKSPVSRSSVAACCSRWRCWQCTGLACSSPLPG
jgi:large subunit ribosomal protein L15